MGMSGSGPSGNVPSANLTGSTAYLDELRKIEKVALLASLDGIDINSYNDFVRLTAEYIKESAQSQETFLTAHALLEATKYLDIEAQKLTRSILENSVGAIFQKDKTAVLKNPTIGIFISGLIEQGYTREAGYFLNSLVRQPSVDGSERNLAGANPSIMKACAQLMGKDSDPSAITLLVLMRATNEEAVANNPNLGDFLTNARTDDEIDAVLSIFNSLKTKRPEEFSTNESAQRALYSSRRVSDRITKIAIDEMTSSSKTIASILPKNDPFAR